VVLELKRSAGAQVAVQEWEELPLDLPLVSDLLGDQCNSILGDRARYQHELFYFSMSFHLRKHVYIPFWRASIP
jgi:hypothetical protein